MSYGQWMEKRNKKTLADKHLWKNYCDYCKPVAILNTFKCKSNFHTHGCNDIIFLTIWLKQGRQFAILVTFIARFQSPSVC